MPTELEVSPRNTDIAQRIEMIFIRDKWRPPTERELAEVTAENYTEKRKRRLTKRAEAPVLGVYRQPTRLFIEADYHPLEREYYHQNSYLHLLPEDFEFPIFGLGIIPSSREVVYVPMSSGGSPNRVITAPEALFPKGTLIKFRPRYFFNKKGHGIRINDMQFENLLDRVPEQELAHATKTTRSHSQLWQPNSLTYPLTEEDDYEFIYPLLDGARRT